MPYGWRFPIDLPAALTRFWRFPIDLISGIPPAVKRLEQFSITRSGATLWVPIYTNYHYQVPQPFIRHAIIMIHGAGGNNSGYFNAIRNAVVNTPGVIILAPLFSELPDGEGQLWWGEGWRHLDRSTSTLPWRISSGEVVDLMLEHLFNTFPNLNSAVVAGFSAGGQMMSRYCATGTDSRVRYAIGAPSNFMYHSNKRRNASGGFSTPFAPFCAYNDYKFGLANLSGTPYVSAIGATEMRNRFENAHVHYLCGAADNDPNHSQLSKDCASKWQGDHRLERMQNFYDHIGNHFGSSIYTRHVMSVIPGAAHTSSAVFNTDPGRTALLNGYTP